MFGFIRKLFPVTLNGDMRIRNAAGLGIVAEFYCSTRAEWMVIQKRGAGEGYIEEAARRPNLFVHDDEAEAGATINRYHALQSRKGEVIWRGRA